MVKSTFIVGDFNADFKKGKRIYKQIEEAQLSVSNRECTSFSSTNGAFTKKAHILGHRKTLVNFEEFVSYFYSKCICIDTYVFGN